MRINLASLETFNRIGTAGADRAAEGLSTLTGLETFVETTKINFAPVDSLPSLVGAEETAVAIDFEGGLDGNAILVFDDETADHVLGHLAGAGDDPDPAYLNEVANIMTSSFVDGWAEHLEETIDISPPTPASDPPGRAEPVDGEEFTFVFQSDIEICGTPGGCRFYLLPEPTSFLETLGATWDESSETDVNVGELSTFIRLTAAGAETVATNLGAMTGIETDVSVSHLDFVPVEDLPGVVDVDEHVGTVFQFSGALDGYLAVLFEDAAADTIADALTPGDSGDDYRQSAIEEVGNITASGFIDGWANALDTTIDHSVPDFVDDMGRAVLESIAVELGLTQEFAYMFDVVITAQEPMTCRMFAIPEADSFRSLVTRLDEDLDVSSVERV
ncbi:chemotaxis protein CheC [Halanaeroarchaeum sulfurireducens]|uniref:Chemotaxis protein CheC2 n=1 Tax=Halanaeroarchaeum sulfurireducens TaxID=1604004 RepID=A0A0F7PAV8_9EURY|nr:chemotaxis protein CheC [Halanaeroarchaeum sulfurireducens]AKH97847.1 chemotaxis protein CheC2 [Halanaeroarchaeum sulfurireducens]ALG82241.1 chemotaxis protein CheC2 [Halanaeroarchaeum sulfurireducens]